MRTLVAVLLCSSSAFAAPGRIGLYPLSLPDGIQQLEVRLAEQLRDGAAALPGVRSFDQVAPSSCGPDEAPCLAEAAQKAGLEAIISAAVTATGSGYRFQLREVAAGGALIHEARGEVRGGPLDLAGALEHGVCEMLSTAPCEGELRVVGEERHQSESAVVDGQDRGALPVTLRLPVGRHAVKVGEAERRVRISSGRTVQLTAAERAGALALLDDPAAAPAVSVVRQAAAAAPVEAVSTPAAQPRATAAHVLFGSGLALLTAGAGVAIYSATSAGSHTNAGLAAVALAATGAGALVAGGLLVALTPSGAALQGRF